jgi:exonuclease III
MIYINKRAKYQQIPIPSSDLTAITTTQGQDTLLIISVYVENHANTEQSTQMLNRCLQHIQAAFQTAKQANPEVKLLLAGDFNRHDTL